MNTQAWISAITAFLIATCGALGVVLVGDAAPTLWQVLAAIALGLVTGAKDVRGLMKLPPVVTILLMAALSFGVVGITGCQTSPAKTAATISDASKITVEAALSAWSDYIPVGKPSLKQQEQVRDAWKKYKSAQILILDCAIIAKESEDAGLNDPQAQEALNISIAEASTALVDLIKLLREFGVKI